jgi:hypothetical protein
MRNPARMHTILGLLGQLWSQHPDTRLLQLCQYVESERAGRLGTEPRGDLFYVEDDEFLEQLQILLDKEIKPVDPFHV